MVDWYARAKAQMLRQEITQEQLMPLFGVTTRGAVGHYLSGRREPSPALMVKLADRLGMSLDMLLRGREPHSQVMGLDEHMLSEALVSLDKALKNKGLKYDAAVVAPALMLAYRERQALPSPLDKAALRKYDKIVLSKLQGEIDEQEEHRPVAKTGVGLPKKAATHK